jgi:hypothetical protein
MVKDRQRRAKADDEPSLWRFWELLAAIVGAIATLQVTELFPVLYWPGVILVYIAFGGMFVDGVRGKWSNHIPWRIVICGIAVLGLAWWTRWVVLAKVPLEVGSMRGMGDYSDGSDIGPVKWNKNWTDLRIYLSDPSSHDLRDVDLEIAVDGMIPQISQMEPVCQGFNAFSESNPISVNVSDNGEETSLPSTGAPFSNRFRVVCDKLPHGTTATLIVPVIATDMDRDSSHPFPTHLFAPKRLPEWCEVKGEYRALGKTRELDSRCEFPN